MELLSQAEKGHMGQSKACPGSALPGAAPHCSLFPEGNLGRGCGAGAGVGALCWRSLHPCTPGGERLKLVLTSGRPGSKHSGIAMETQQRRTTWGWEGSNGQCLVLRGGP